MPTLIPAPTIGQAAGTKPKRIEEYAGGAEYMAVYRPAFSPATVHRDG